LFMNISRFALPWLIPCVLLLPCAGQEVPDQAELEKRFQERMSGCRMVGAFTTDGTSGEGSAGAKKESYTISKVTKVKDGRWKFYARIQYAEKKAITVPLVVGVEWAGDTAMIQVTRQKIPFFGTFTARVLIYGDRYAGIWDGGDHGGQMFGRIERLPAEDQPEDGGDEVGDDQSAGNWPSFHGAFGRGVADGYETPTQFSGKTGDGVLWKAPVPGLCHSSPIVWGDRIFVTTAVKADGDPNLRIGLYGDIKPVENEGSHDFRILCLDKKSGAILWSKTAWSGEPRIKRHPKGTHAASTPATDGTHVVAFFGTEGLYAYDYAGKQLWKRDFGVLDGGFFRDPTAQWGFASSPVIHDGKVLIQVDVQGDSFVAALDVKTGKTLWRTAREEVPTWCTPTVHVTDSRSQVICNGWKHIGGYDLATGKELWKLEGGGDIPVPTPIVADDLIYITSAHGRYAPILAIKAGATGTLSMDASKHDDVVWGQTRRGNYMQTPIAYGGLLYCCNDAGMLSVYDARTGKNHYRERLGVGYSGFTGSGVAADGKLYFTSEEGKVHVIEKGETFRRLAINDLGESCLSTPAVSKGVLFFRARNHLIAVGAR